MSADERYKLLYEVAKTEYLKEDARFARIDDKTSKLLTFLTIIVVAITAIATNLRVIDFISACPASYYYIYIGIIFLFSVSTIICFISAWVCYGEVNHNNLAIDQKLVEELMADSSADPAYFKVAKAYSDCISLNDEQNTKKSKCYNWCYYAFLGMKIFFIIFISYLVFLLCTIGLEKKEPISIKSCNITYNFNQIQDKNLCLTVKKKQLSH